MSYNTKKLFTKAISNVTKEFGSLNNEGDVEIDLPKSKRTTTQRIKDAFLEAGSEGYMEAYTNTLNTLTAAQRNRPRFSNAKIYMGQTKPGMARGSTFGAISESNPEKLLKENRARMKDFVISKAYLKA